MPSKIFKRQLKGDRVFLYVVVKEHRYFPPDHDKMVAATPMEIYESSERAITHVRSEAKRLKSMQHPSCELKEYVDNNRTGNLHEFRLWYDCKDDDKVTDRLCWVVRRVEVMGL